MNHLELVEGLILCGGQAQRMGGQDKGLIALNTKPLYQHGIERLVPQVGHIMLNANRHQDIYGKSGYPVYSDTYPGFVGPLAGFHVGLSHCKAPYLVIIPCDSPLFPENLVQLLFQNLESQQADIAYVVTRNTGQEKQSHPVFCLMRNGLKNHLSAFLDSGQRKIDKWFGQLRSTEVMFASDDAFININTPEELIQVESRLK